MLIKSKSLSAALAAVFMAAGAASIGATPAKAAVYCKTAGVPQGWMAGDKTGSGDNGAVNDIAVVWPPGRLPLLIAAYCTGSKRPLAEIEQAHADIARAVVAALIR